MRSAVATGPPLAKMLSTAEPTSMRFVRWKESCESWKKSVHSPTSPSQCGITGFRLPFWVSVERCA